MLEAALSISPEGDVPKHRISSPEHLIATHKRYKKEDETAAYFRMLCQRAIDGEAPLKTGKLKSLGLDGVSNQNFGEAEGIFEAAKSPYLEIINGVPMQCDIVSTYGDENESADIGQIISEEYDWAFKEWPLCSTNTDLLAGFFVGDGVAVTGWEQERSVFWEPYSLGKFLTDRDTKPIEHAVECATITRRVKVGELYGHIKDEAHAAHWNVSAVKEAIIKCAKNVNKRNSMNAWDEFAQAIKENDIHLGEQEYNTVELIIGFVKEFDGTVSVQITTDDCKEWLYRRSGVYNNMGNAFVMYTYGVGGGALHTIRGLKHKIFKLTQASNILLNRALDGAMLSSTIPMQGSAEALANLRLLNIGPWTLVPEGINPIQNYMVPNVGQNTLPVHSLMMRTLSNVTGTYANTTGSENGGNAPISAAEAQIREQNKAQLSVAAMDQFYRSWDRTHSETVRRALNPRLQQNDTDGKIAFEFRRRCMKRGVTPEALSWQYIGSVNAMRSVGNGSPAMRSMAMQQVFEISSSFDEAGRFQAKRDVVAAIPGVGYRNAVRYTGKGVPRIPMDFDIAQGENTAILVGRKPIWRSEQNQSVHARVILDFIVERMELVQQGGAEIEAEISNLRASVDHAFEHVSALSEDVSRRQEAGQARKELQNLSAFVNQQEQRIVAKMEAEAEQMAPQAETDPKAALELQKKQFELESKKLTIQAQRERHEQELERIKAQMSQADMAAARDAAKETLKLQQGK